MRPGRRNSSQSDQEKDYADDAAGVCQTAEDRAHAQKPGVVKEHPQ